MGVLFFIVFGGSRAARTARAPQGGTATNQGDRLDARPRHLQRRGTAQTALLFAPA